MKIITNRVPRDIIDAHELTAAEREEFDYLKWDAIDEGTDSALFLRYRGTLYDLGNFMIGSAPQGWDAGFADSAFSGIIIRLTSDCEQVIVGYALT